MKSPEPPQPMPDCVADLFRLTFGGAMDDGVVAVPLESDHRELSTQPKVESIVHEQIRQPNLRAVRNAVFEYIEIYYNRKRPHSSIENMTPSETEHNFLRTIDSEMTEAA